MMKLQSLTLVAILLMPSFAAAQSSSNSSSIKAPVLGESPEKMQMHGTAVVGERIYLFGGDLAGGDSETLWTTHVYSAAINKKSLKLETWRAEVPLPDMRSYVSNCVEVVNDRIYILGGMVATVATDEKSGKVTSEVIWTRVKEDGSLSPWTKAVNYPSPPVLFTATCSNDKYLYMLGGQSSKIGQAAINVADIKPDGSLASWRKAGELPIPLYAHGASVQHDRIYVWGGLRAPGSPNLRTFSTPISSTGQIGEWREEASMPASAYGSAFCGINDYIVSVCGRSTGNLPTNNILFSRLDNTRVKEWQTVHTDIKSNVYNSLGVYKDLGWVIVTGGMMKDGNQSSLVSAIQAFQVPQPQSSQLNLKDAASGGNGFGSYPDLDTALKQAAEKKKQVLVFFYSPVVPASKVFWSAATADPKFAAIKDKYIIAR